MNSNFGNISWGSADGKKTKFNDMKVGHLVNVINWVSSSPDNYPFDFVTNLIDFANTKAFVLFCDKKPYPFNDDGRWIVVDPNSGFRGVIPPPQEYIDFIKEHAPDLLPKVS